MKLFLRILALCFTAAAIILAAVVFGSWAVVRQANVYIVQPVDVGEAQVAIVPGASVYRSGQPSDILADRLTVAYDLYLNEHVQKILVSGDHGQAEYDEVNAMKNYLLEKGVAPEDIFLDHAGFDTYDTMYRAKNVFQIESAIVVTQRFHLPRSLYLARSVGIQAIGVSSDLQTYQEDWYYGLREWLANVKAVGNIVLESPPTFEGEPIPISGDGQVSWD